MYLYVKKVIKELYVCNIKIRVSEEINILIYKIKYILGVLDMKKFNGLF